MMSLRENLDAFTLFKAEYAEAEKSIRLEQSVHWKEMLAVLSFAMNYPAKHFS
jgi:epoxyqueuosine reductase QueG